MYSCDDEHGCCRAVGGKERWLSGSQPASVSAPLSGLSAMLIQLAFALVSKYLLLFIPDSPQPYTMAFDFSMCDATVIGKRSWGLYVPSQHKRLKACVAY